MKAHIDLESTYEHGRDDGAVTTLAVCLLALHNLYDWHGTPLMRVYTETLRILDEAASEPDWLERIRGYLEQLGIRWKQ